MACSKSTASAGGDKKAKVPKELLTPKKNTSKPPSYGNNTRISS
jgi:hypothetical protein